MVQAEYGLQSGCKCPECGNMCRDCMGSVQEPLCKEKLAARYADTAYEITPINEERIEECSEEQDLDWRKLL